MKWYVIYVDDSRGFYTKDEAMAFIEQKGYKPLWFIHGKEVPA